MDGTSAGAAGSSGSIAANGAPPASPTLTTEKVSSGSKANGSGVPGSSTSGSSTSGTSLSERIAALQRVNQTPESSPRRPANGLGTPSSLGGAGRSVSASAAGASASAGGSNAVRDRIARFQATAASETPLLPRSSFGAPAPNPELAKGQRSRMNLSAGTGNWGETLRPQLTGGSWLQVGGAAGSGGDGVRPQLTGSIYGVKTMPTGRGGAPFPAHTPSAQQPSTPTTDRFSAAVAAAAANRSASGTPSSSRIVGGGADAFAELDGEAETETARYYRKQRELQQGHSSAENQSPTKAHGASGSGAATPADMPSGAPNFPKTPDTEVNDEAINRDRQAAMTGGLDDSEETKMLKLLTPPVETPVRAQPGGPRRSEPASVARTGAALADLSLDSAASGDTSLRDPLVDIGVQGTTPDKLRQLQARADRIIDSEEKKPPLGSPSASSAWPREDVFGGAAASPTPSASSRKDPLVRVARPQRADLSSSSSEYSVDSADFPATAGPMSSVDGRFEAAQAALSGNGVRGGSDMGNASTDATFGGGDDSRFTMVSTSSSDVLGSEQSAGRAGSTTSHSTASTSGTPAKAKSQKLKRPPVGRILSAAELDASDDEYEPGWASIITPRNP